MWGTESPRGWRGLPGAPRVGPGLPCRVHTLVLVSHWDVRLWALWAWLPEQVWGGPDKFLRAGHQRLGGQPPSGTPEEVWLWTHEAFLGPGHVWKQLGLALPLFQSQDLRGEPWVPARGLGLFSPVCWAPCPWTLVRGTQCGLGALPSIPDMCQEETRRVCLHVNLRVCFPSCLRLKPGVSCRLRVSHSAPPRAPVAGWPLG